MASQRTMIANRFIINDPTRDLLGRGGMGAVSPQIIEMIRMES